MGLTPKGLEAFPAKTIKGVFSDLDDTLTENGRIAAGTFSALWKLRELGYSVVIVSGRPAGWADCLMRAWPLDAMVFENGAGYAWRDGEKIKTVTLAKEGIKEQQARLTSVFETIKKQIPELKLATDQPFRLCDYAIDFGEEPPHLTEAQIDLIMGLMEKEKGITAKLSSIHVNYWCGSHTKVTAVEAMLATWGKTRGLTRDNVVYCGDSPNDEPLFEYFPNSVGVANVTRYLPKMKSPPKFITKKDSGDGFQEVATRLASTRLA